MLGGKLKYAVTEDLANLSTALVSKFINEKKNEVVERKPIERLFLSNQRTAPYWIKCLKCEQDHVISGCKQASDEEKLALVKKYKDSKASPSVNQVGSERGKNTLHIGDYQFPFVLDFRMFRTLFP